MYKVVKFINNLLRYLKEMNKEQKEKVAEEILDIVNHRDDFTQSDLQGAIDSLVEKFNQDYCIEENLSNEINSFVDNCDSAITAKDDDVFGKTSEDYLDEAMGLLKRINKQ